MKMISWRKLVQVGTSSSSWQALFTVIGGSRHCKRIFLELHDAFQVRQQPTGTGIPSSGELLRDAEQQAAEMARLFRPNRVTAQRGLNPGAQPFTPLRQTPLSREVNLLSSSPVRQEQLPSFWMKFQLVYPASSFQGAISTLLWRTYFTVFVGSNHYQRVSIVGFSTFSSA